MGFTRLPKGVQSTMKVKNYYTGGKKKNYYAGGNLPILSAQPTHVLNDQSGFPSGGKAYRHRPTNT